jgi:hypothetical protein
MKTAAKYTLSFFLFAYLNGNAQDKAGTRSEIPSKTSAKGRKELRKDERVKYHEEKNLKSNKEKQQTKSDKPFVKKEHLKAPKNEKKEEEIIKKK